MLNVSDIIREVKKLFGDRVPYDSYNFKDTFVLFGVTPIKDGLDSIEADRDFDDARLVMSLNGTGVFVSNNNQSGTIRLQLLQGVAASGAMQLENLLGMPLPLFAVDKKSMGTSFVFAPSARLVKTPAWRRGKAPSRLLYTFKAPRLWYSEGIRQAA